MTITHIRLVNPAEAIVRVQITRNTFATVPVFFLPSGSWSMGREISVFGFYTGITPGEAAKKIEAFVKGKHFRWLVDSWILNNKQAA